MECTHDAECGEGALARRAGRAIIIICNLSRNTTYLKISLACFTAHWRKTCPETQPTSKFGCCTSCFSQCTMYNVQCTYTLDYSRLQFNQMHDARNLQCTVDRPKPTYKSTL